MSASREQLQAVLDEETRRWEGRSWEELTGLDDPLTYEVAGGYQVELTVVERRPDFVQVVISVADGGWRSFLPLTTSVVVNRRNI
jgi:hypothetical protein